MTIIFGGGATGPTIAYALQFLAGLLLLGAVLWRDGLVNLRRAPLLVQALVVVLFALPLIQLLPLPPGVGQGASGRHTANAIRALAGAGSDWMPLTLAPQPTAQVVFSLAILLGLFLSVLRLDARGTRLVVSTVLGLAVLTVVVGALQLTSGGALFNFFDSPHRFNLIGFFANRNHTAVFLASAIPLACGLLAGARADARRVLVVGGVVTVAVAVAVLGTVSRAGLMLVAAGFLLSLLLLVPLPRKRGLIVVGAAAAGTAVFALLLFTNSAVGRVFDRYADVGEDLRWRFYTRTVELVPQFLPWGGGLGSFVPIYTANERLADVQPEFVNNAHNDYLELLLEGGALSAALIVLSVLTVVWCGIGLARRRPEGRELGWAGLIVVVLFLLHSAVDYPLRRMACAALFTLALGLLVRPLLRPAPARSSTA